MRSRGSFVPNTTTQKGAHIRDCNDMKRTMIVVVVALLPALLFGMYNTGYQVGMTGWEAFWFGFLQVLPMIVVSYVVVWASSSPSRRRAATKSTRASCFGPVDPDGDARGDAAVDDRAGTAFAVVFGKEVFGGTGMNVFNPRAAGARAFVFAYTPQMSGEKVVRCRQRVGVTAPRTALDDGCDELFGI